MSPQPSPTTTFAVDDDDDTLYDIMQESKIFRALLLGHQDDQEAKIEYDESDRLPSSVPSSLIFVDTIDQRPTKHQRLGYSNDYDYIQGVELLPLENSFIPESPRLSYLSESLSDVPELFLPPLCEEEDTHHAQRRSGLRRVVDRRRLVGQRRRLIRSLGLAEVTRGSETYVSASTKRPAHSEDYY
ncbi:hypothetical protein Pmar_PMAR022122 [Perkinsus marinus ATCC 50983]|uniref:Uncharacterized protein n=1 Tax=Perkinsus marinus (strain ATCC 50983 / TXsc) TaxID=423536 RepID=C5L0N3_PERM5|nr:hypothetical protein Pmar_PMAR022122 [Perkinsus marinus ATCC 50983]EER09685.1 hypothetical protein Pmar_PMAR022122 [Perkinsus marinus ATCC 50983]|eukprot:XP_002777890.1 hypothetical protein Pmar_PMAR022122 [Perkinsus marinus ATCC 50983]